MNIQLSAIKNEIKQTASLGIPFVASQFVFAASAFIGTVMVARLGEGELAASSLGSILWITLLAIFFSVLNAVGILVAHQHGAKNNKGISDIMGQAYLIGFVLCILMILVLSMTPKLLYLSHQPAEVLMLAKQYIDALLWSVPGLILFVIMEQFLAGIGRAKMVLNLSLFVVLMEIPCNYIFVFGKLGLPAFGVAGIGYGLTVAYTAAAIGIIFYLLRSKMCQPFAPFSSIKSIQPHLIKELLRIGLPLGLMHGIEVTAFSIATLWIAQFGTVWLAAHQISIQYLSLFITTFVMGMSQAVSIRVGHAVGREDKPGLQLAMVVGTVLGFACIVLVALALYFFPQTFIHVDINIHDPQNAELVKNASSLLSICAVLLLFDNFRIIGLGALRALKDTRFPMIVSFFSFLGVALLLAYGLGFKLNLKGEGIWWGVTSGVIIGAIVIGIRLGYVLRRVDLKKMMGKT